MRRARSYSIVDHELLHGGFLQRLSHEALALYLFLVVVSDRDGKSFYGEASIASILRLDDVMVVADELIQAKLIEYRRPYWFVLSLHPMKRRPALDSTTHKVSQPQSLQELLGGVL